MPIEILIIALSIAAILLVVLLMVIYNKSQKEKISPLDINFLEDLAKALGENNIESIDIENKRIRLVLKDVKNVNAKSLKELDVPAFLKGKELKILIKEHTKEVYNFLTERGKNNE